MRARFVALIAVAALAGIGLASVIAEPIADALKGEQERTLFSDLHPCTDGIEDRLTKGQCKLALADPVIKEGLAAKARVEKMIEPQVAQLEADFQKTAKTGEDQLKLLRDYGALQARAAVYHDFDEAAFDKRVERYRDASMDEIAKAFHEQIETDKATAAEQAGQ